MYAKPFWEALRDGNHAEMQKYLNRGYCFRLGVYMAMPHSRFGEAFNRIDMELEKEIKAKK